MKRNSPTKLAEQCAARLYDENWDQLLAGRVEAARRWQMRTRAVLGVALLVFSVFAMLGTATWSEEQQWAAIFDETPYTLNWGHLSE